MLIKNIIVVIDTQHIAYPSLTNSKLSSSGKASVDFFDACM
jgi:hypothetical protein